MQLRFGDLPHDPKLWAPASKPIRGGIAEKCELGFPWNEKAYGTAPHQIAWVVYVEQLGDFL